jgi:hypothetical protein
MPPTKEIPGSLLHKLSFSENSLVLEHEVQVLRVVDDHTGRQSWDGDLNGLVTKLTFTGDKPGEQFLPSLEKPQPVANEWQGIWRFPIESSALSLCLMRNGCGFCTYLSAVPFLVICGRNI